MSPPSDRVHGKESTPAGRRRPAVGGSPPAFDPAAFRETIGEHELMLELLDLFDEDADDLLDQMRAALKAGKVEELREAAHALRGMLGNFAAEPAVAAAAALSAPARRGDLAGAADAWPRLEREVERLRGELRRFRDTLSP